MDLLGVDEVQNPVEDLDFVQKTMAFMGLDTPALRFMAGFTLTSSVIMVAKPRISFDGDGNALSWKLTNKEGTQLTWWMPGLVVGGVLAIFF